jgi:multicomponent Na+:H+ antiporter subunit C
MTLLFALTIGFLFGTGVFLVLKPDLFRIVVGLVLISNAANLTLMASRMSGGEPPIRPFDSPAIADPLVQALTLTAIVIGFAVTALLLSLVYRVYTSHRSVDLDDLSRAEAAREQELEREEMSV